MFAFFIKIFIVLNLPLPPLILAKGLRRDRIFFAFYLTTFLIAAYFLSQSTLPHFLHWGLFFTIVNLIWINLFFLSQAGPKDLSKSKLVKISPFPLFPFPVILIILFLLDYSPELFKGYFYFPRPLFTPLALVSTVLSLLMLTMGWERLERTQTASKGERILRMGIIMWWLVFLSLFSRMIFTGDLASIALFQSLFFFHLILITGIYPLVFQKGFLEVHAHPSPQFVGHATRSILVLGVLTLFFWFEALGKKWGLPNYSITLISVIILVGILLFPLLPFRPFESLQRIFYHHLYLPEQDFALEVSHYLKVMRGEESLERIMVHLRERLQIESALLYRSVEGKENKWKLYLSSSFTSNFPAQLSNLSEPGATIEKAHLIKSVSLKAKEEILGHLFLLGNRTKLSFEEESLIRFWSETLGLLLNELELREREKEQEKLAHFSQATSFLLHDAKNLAQLLELLLKNFQNLKGEDLVAFFQESLPALDQARTRARRILEKLETFQPLSPPILQKTDIGKILEEVVKSISLSLKKESISFHLFEGKTPWKGDPNALKIVIENLILNGLQAESDEGKVEVNLSEEENGYHIRVKDQGQGIPEENRGKIFKPFFTTKRGGSGLGLYQAKVLIEKMDGKIWHEPNLPKGSIFHVWVGKNTNH